jgi:hypothetical protein
LYVLEHIDLQHRVELLTVVPRSIDGIHNICHSVCFLITLLSPFYPLDFFITKSVRPASED